MSEVSEEEGLACVAEQKCESRKWQDQQRSQFTETPEDQWQNLGFTLI